MPQRIYLLREGQEPVPMDVSYYDSESLLQGLLASHPQLLSGDEINSEQPRRWLLVSREFDVPNEEEGSRRWSLDHLFLDQDGIPTLVEVKRSTDTRIRREVVGQMLDYAANAVAYIPVERLRARYESRCDRENLDGDAHLREFLQNTMEPEAFWTAVTTNLQAGKIRLIFVADVIPDELRRVIEFLNGQMSPCEVYGLEVSQFTGSGLQTLVPSIVGRTAISRARKNTSSSRTSISRDEFIAKASELSSPGEVDFMKLIISVCDEKKLIAWCGGSASGASYIAAVPRNDKDLYPFSLKANGVLNLQMRFICAQPPFDDQGLRQELRRKCELISGWNIRGGMEGLPMFNLAEVLAKGDQGKVLEILRWMIEKISK